MKTMDKKIYVKPQMELLEDAVTMILAASGDAIDDEGYGQFGGARQQDMSNFDFDEEEE